MLIILTLKQPMMMDHVVILDLMDKLQIVTVVENVIQRHGSVMVMQTVKTKLGVQTFLVMTMMEVTVVKLCLMGLVVWILQH